MFKRNLPLPPPSEDTFFLWGPRQTGKTTLLRQRYPDARWVDLLKADEFRRYMANPERLREEIEAAGSPLGGQVVIDEIQKAPALLGGRVLCFDLRGLTAASVEGGGLGRFGADRAERGEAVGSFDAGCAGLNDGALVGHTKRSVASRQGGAPIRESVRCSWRDVGRQQCAQTGVDTSAIGAYSACGRPGGGAPLVSTAFTCQLHRSRKPALRALSSSLRVGTVIVSLRVRHLSLVEHVSGACGGHHSEPPDGSVRSETLR